MKFAAILVAIIALEGTALAEPAGSGRTSALSWVRLPGAEGCMGAPKLAAAVEDRLGRRVFVPPADAEISVEGTVAFRADTKRFKASFRVADRSGAVLGVRDVEESAATCDKLDDRFAFVLSVLIDPDALGGPAAIDEPTPLPPPSRSAAAPPPPVARTDSPEPPPRGPAPSAPEPWRWLAGADFGGSGGLVPEVGWVVSAFAIVTPPHWPGLRAKGSSFLPASQPVERSASTDISLVLGQVGICPLQIRRPPFGFSACLDGMLGELSAQGAGFAESRRYATWIGGVALDVVAELAVTRTVLLTASPALVVPLSRVRLAYDDATGSRRTLYEAAPAGGSLALGVAVGAR